MSCRISEEHTIKLAPGEVLIELKGDFDNNNKKEIWKESQNIDAKHSAEINETTTENKINNFTN